MLRQSLLYAIMSGSFPFVVPSIIPQDLQLIHDIIGPIPVASSSKLSEDSHFSDHEHGTDSDTDSEQVVEADILATVDEDDMNRYVAFTRLS